MRCGDSPPTLKRATMLITHPTAHSQTFARAPTPAPTRGPEAARGNAPASAVLPVLLAVVAERGPEPGTWRLEPLNLARIPTPGQPGSGQPASGQPASGQPGSGQPASIPGGLTRMANPAPGTIPTPTAEPSPFAYRRAATQPASEPHRHNVRVDSREPASILLRARGQLAPGMLVPVEAHTDGWRVADRSLSPASLLTMLRPMLGTPASTWGELGTNLTPAQMGNLPPLTAMTPALLSQLPADTGTALQYLARLLRMNTASPRPSSAELRSEKLVADRVMVLHLLTALASRASADTESWLLETPVRVDDKLEVLQLQISHQRPERAEEDEWLGSAATLSKDEDQWQLRLLFNLDPLGSFGAWLRWSEAEGLAVDCWIESRPCFAIATELQAKLHATLERIGVNRLSLHAGAMPQPAMPLPGGSNVNVTV